MSRFAELITNNELYKHVFVAVENVEKCLKQTATCSTAPQVKIELPVHMHEKHHVLFTFYHISCESSSKASSKKREGVESLGECWTTSLNVTRQKKCILFYYYFFFKIDLIDIQVVSVW